MGTGEMVEDPPGAVDAPEALGAGAGRHPGREDVPSQRGPRHLYRREPWRARDGSPGPKLPPALVIIVVAALLLVVSLLVSRATQWGARPTKVLGQQQGRTAPSPPGGSVSVLAGYSLVYADSGSDVSVVPFAGARHTFQDFSANGYPDRPIRTGQAVAFVRAGTLYRLTAPYTGVPEPVGPADRLFPALTPGVVGVHRGPGLGGLSTLELVSVQPGGGGGSGLFALQPDYVPVAQLRSGFLVWEQPTPGLLRVWRLGPAGAGGFGRTLGTAAAVLGTSGDRVAWLAASGCDPAGECPLHITDASSGKDVVVTPPPGYAGFLDGGSFSSAGNVLAAFVYDPVRGTPAARLVLVSLISQAGRQQWSAAVVAQSDVPVANGVPESAVWTADGAHVLFSGPSGRVHDYRPGDAASFATDQPASASFTVVLR